MKENIPLFNTFLLLTVIFLLLTCLLKIEQNHSEDVRRTFRMTCIKEVVPGTTTRQLNSPEDLQDEMRSLKNQENLELH